MLVEDSAGEGPNHPLAFRMAVIAFLNQNITIACVWGSFSVLLGAVEARLGVGRELSTVAVPLVNLATALFAPVVGTLVARVSIRLVMLAGTALSLAGFLLLAVVPTYPAYLAAYGLLLGPGMAVGAVLPAALVTRWYVVDRGRALGLVCMPVMVAIVPLVSNWTLSRYGLTGTYGVLAALTGVALAANLFIVDRPPGGMATAAAASQGGFTMARLLRAPVYWALAIGFIASICGSIILTAHMVPMAKTWGFSATSAATLLAAQSFAGMAGTILFGWIADRIGGVATLALLLIDAAVLWVLLSLHPGFATTALIVGLIGVHGAGAVPVLGIALSETFGRESFGRAFGLLNLINLPFSVAAVPAAAIVYARTGSYSAAIFGEAAFLLLGGVIVLIARRARRPMAG